MAELSTALRLYRSLSPAASALTGLVAPFSAKLRTGLAGRRDLMTRLTAAADRLQGCIWVHVTSVGEYEQARPIIAAIAARAARTGASQPPVAVTHFSPSGYEFALKRPCADLHDYLPFDDPAIMRRLVRAWNPRLLLFVKFDCWPNQVLAAAEHGVPVFLLAGALQPRSFRLHPLARSLFRDVFDRFTHIGVCTPDDQRRFEDQLGVSAPVSVTGDTRIEQVILRYEAAAEGEVARRLKGLGGRLLILGSTWPPDEQLWLPALPQLLERFADLRVVLVPHEPLPERLTALEARLDRRKIPRLRLSRLLAADPPLTENAPARCILVDSIGVLAEIYRAGSLAYVGGSFTTGVHNTMEPAVASLPVLFGPVIQNAEEAGLLVQRQAGQVLREPEDAITAVAALLADEARLASVGAAARQVVLDQRGATEKSLAVLAPYL